MLMENNPLVTVICLCYNQERFVVESLRSVTSQDYQPIQLIVVDDASQDNSTQVIQEFIKDQDFPIQFIQNDNNLGNCRSFNKALALAHGKYIIDLAADDILQPHRIRIGVETFESLDARYGVHYSKALSIDKDGQVIDNQDHPIPTNHEGDVYQTLITDYWINPASMMMKKKCLDDLGGYNEELTYEDFDFWIRSSRNWKYAYTDEVLVKKRELSTSLGKQQGKWRNKYQQSTLAVCKTIKNLNKDKKENAALKKRIRYEIKQCLLTGNIELIFAYLKLYLTIG
jgi:glycosyltransferase involved in cell wall biosynthesis